MLPPRFATDRLDVENWLGDLREPLRRAALEADLTKILTPAVLAHLPPPLQLENGAPDVPDWIDARAAESDVFTARTSSEGALVGLLILAAPPPDDGAATIHIGYLLAERAWGQGLASELIAGLVTALRPIAPMRLMGGVDAGNPASARVLEKAGFLPNPTLSEAGNHVFSLDLT